VAEEKKGKSKGDGGAWSVRRGRDDEETAGMTMCGRMGADV